VVQIPMTFVQGPMIAAGIAGLITLTGQGAGFGNRWYWTNRVAGLMGHPGAGFRIFCVAQAVLSSIWLANSTPLRTPPRKAGLEGITGHWGSVGLRNCTVLGIAATNVSRACCSGILEAKLPLNRSKAIILY